jgi:hypothetical protein
LQRAVLIGFARPVAHAYLITTPLRLDRIG